MISIESHNIFHGKRLQVLGKLNMDLIRAEAKRDAADNIKEHQLWTQTAMEIKNDIAKVNSRHWMP